MKMKNLEVQQGLKFGDLTPAAFDKSVFRSSASTAMRITDDHRR